MEYRVERSRHANRYSIIIEKCPMCGRPGVLRRCKNKFIIVHEGRYITSQTTCHVGRNKDPYEELQVIYNKVRGKDKK